MKIENKYFCYFKISDSSGKTLVLFLFLIFSKVQNYFSKFLLCSKLKKMKISNLSNFGKRLKISHSSDKTLGYDLHGFQDSRLALVRRSMIARRTQARLREKRRRNRTVALSPEDDRRSSFISTFLADTKLLQDQSVQVPSQTSTLSNKDEVMNYK